MELDTFLESLEFAALSLEYFITYSYVYQESNTIFVSPNPRFFQYGTFG